MREIGLREAPASERVRRANSCTGPPAPLPRALQAQGCPQPFPGGATRVQSPSKASESVVSRRRRPQALPWQRPSSPGLLPPLGLPPGGFPLPKKTYHLISTLLAPVSPYVIAHEFQSTYRSDSRGEDGSSARRSRRHVRDCLNVTSPARVLLRDPLSHGSGVLPAAALNTNGLISFILGFNRRNRRSCGSVSPSFKELCEGKRRLCRAGVLMADGKKFWACVYQCHLEVLGRHVGNEIEYIDFLERIQNPSSGP